VPLTTGSATLNEDDTRRSVIVATIRLTSREEAQQTRATKAPGPRRARMDQFDAYARALIENPDEAVVYEDIEEDQQKFVLSLRGAFQRAGVPAIVRTMRGRNEVRAWTGAPVKRAPRAPRAAAPPAAEPAVVTPRRGRGRPKTAASA
jgi:hypothetical protein